MYLFGEKKLIIGKCVEIKFKDGHIKNGKGVCPKGKNLDNGVYKLGKTGIYKSGHINTSLVWN